MDKQLQGTPGTTTYEQARDGTVIPTGASTATPAVDGSDVS